MKLCSTLNVYWIYICQNARRRGIHIATISLAGYTTIFINNVGTAQSFPLPSHSIHSPTRSFQLLLTKPSHFSITYKLFLPKLRSQKWRPTWILSPLPLPIIKLLTFSLLPISLLHCFSLIPSFPSWSHHLCFLKEIFPRFSQKPHNLFIQWPQCHFRLSFFKSSVLSCKGKPLCHCFCDWTTSYCSLHHNQTCHPWTFFTEFADQTHHQTQ